MLRWHNRAPCLAGSAMMANYMWHGELRICKMDSTRVHYGQWDGIQRRYGVALAFPRAESCGTLSPELV